MADANKHTLKFLQEAQNIVPAGSAPFLELGKNLQKFIGNDASLMRKGSFLQNCPFCYSLLLPSLATISTVSRKRLKKSKQHFPVLNIIASTQPASSGQSFVKKQKIKHFMKIHCKVCKRTHLIPFSQKKSLPSSKPCPRTPSSVKSTPNRRRSLDLKSLIRQTTPKTPSTPSLLDFLYT